LKGGITADEEWGTRKKRGKNLWRQKKFYQGIVQREVVRRVGGGVRVWPRNLVEGLRRG